MRRWLERFAEALAAGTAGVDVGAGPGCDSAELRGLGLSPIALDLSLGLLRARLGELPGRRVQADARLLPLPDGSVDGVWANVSLLHLDPGEAGAVLREARRVLRVPGLLHVSVEAGRGSEWESERYGGPRWLQYGSGDELDALLAHAGFEVTASGSTSTPRADWLVRHAVPATRGRRGRRSSALSGASPSRREPWPRGRGVGRAP